MNGPAIFIINLFMIFPGLSLESPKDIFLCPKHSSESTKSINCNNLKLTFFKWSLSNFYVSRTFLGKSKRHIFQYLLTFYLSRSNFFLNVLDLWDKESIKNSLVCLLSGKKFYVRQSFWPIHTTFSMQVFFSDGYLIMHSFFRFFLPFLSFEFLCFLLY